MNKNNNENNEMEIFKKIITEQEKLLKSITDILPMLEKIESTLAEVNRSTGATARYEAFKEEILLKGWDIVSSIYDPKNNTKDPAAIPMFEFANYVYEDMKRKGEI
jgi:hypothetical protein